MTFSSYCTETYWQKYQTFFPPRARVSAETAPKEEWFESQGAFVHLDRYPQKDSPVTVIVVHGGGGYGRLFAPIGLLLNKAGYEVVAPDLPGYGLSSKDVSLVSYEVWIRVLNELVISEHQRSGRPVVLCGGSLGGYLAYLCAASSPLGLIAGLIATTLADPRLDITKKQFAKNRLILKVGLPLMPFFVSIAKNLALPIKWFTKMDAMSNNPTLSKLVALDPLGGGAKVPVGFMHSIFQVKPEIEPENFNACPVLLVHPMENRWTQVESSHVLFDKLKTEKSIVMLEACGHFPIEEPGFSQLENAALNFLQRVSAQVKGRAQPIAQSDKPASGESAT